jgi:hypothetical protein
MHSFWGWVVRDSTPTQRVLLTIIYVALLSCGVFVVLGWGWFSWFRPSSPGGFPWLSLILVSAILGVIFTYYLRRRR